MGGWGGDVYLHVPSNTQQKAEMDAECSDVCPRFTGDPEDNQMSLSIVLVELGAVDAPYSELPLDR